MTHFLWAEDLLPDSEETAFREDEIEAGIFLRPLIYFLWYDLGFLSPEKNIFQLEDITMA
jgi:hypothetical protein